MDCWTKSKLRRSSRVVMKPMDAIDEGRNDVRGRRLTGL